jgi:hypothetical protein
MSGRLRDDVNVSGKMEIICAISGLAILINRVRGESLNTASRELSKIFSNFVFIRYLAGR